MQIHTIFLVLTIAEIILGAFSSADKEEIVLIRMMALSCDLSCTDALTIT
jgi:hypothetical protein